MVMFSSTVADVAAQTSVGAMHTLALWQAQDSINSGNSKLLMIFIGIAAFALLAQAIVVAIAGLGVMKAQKVIMEHVAEIKGKVMPLIENSHALVTDLTPQVKQITSKVNTLVTDLTPEIKLITTKVHDITQKVDQITGHLEEIAVVAKDKVNEFGPTISAANVTLLEANETVRAANRKSREQIERMDGMVTGALDATVNMGTSIGHAITAPVREVSAMFNSAKESLESAYSGAKSSVGSMSDGTKSFFSSLVDGVRGIATSYFAGKPRRTNYPPAGYRSNPATPAPPTKHIYAGEDRFDPSV
jgi:phage-related protein